MLMIAFHFFDLPLSQVTDLLFLDPVCVVAFSFSIPLSQELNQVKDWSYFWDQIFTVQMQHTLVFTK